jgi:AAA+ superfamily predicted ATPase
MRATAKLVNYIRAGYSGLYIVSHEEQRVEAEFKAIANDIKFNLFFWTCVDGLVNTSSSTPQQNNVLDPLEALEAIRSLKDKTIILLKDFHLFLVDPNPMLLRKFKDVLAESKTKNHALVVLGCRLALPPELEREITVVEFKLPDKAQLSLVLDGVVESATESGKKLPKIQTEAVLDAAAGLTTTEAENAFALAVVEVNEVDPWVIAREKAHAINKSALLELVERRPTLNSIGGLDVLKTWLLKRRHAFTKKAREYGLPHPGGLLIIGLAGCGKSQTAKATAEVFGVPLLRLDAGKLFAGLVGGSEANLRAAIQTAEAIAPCCLWIDELEKSFAGSKSSGSTDGGTSARVLGSFLSWMQEKTSPVFVVATANDVQQLPPELLRRGRFDETFFVDLPNQHEREAIWKIVISDYSRDPKDFDLVQLSRITDGFTGAEIRAAFFDAMFEAFESEDEPTDLYIAEVLNGFVPLSKLMAESINELRAWSKGRARLATTSAASPPARARKLAA